MTLRVAFQMDPMETVDIDADTTFALAEVAQARGCLLYTSPSPRDQRGSRMPSSA